MFLTKNMSQKMATFLGRLTYICLLIGGFLFSKDAFDQYIDGKSATEVTQAPITVEDLPTVTICYEKNINNCPEFDFVQIKYSVWVHTDVSLGRRQIVHLFLF